jgi:hypothetical protein
MLDRHDSKFVVRRVQNLRMREISRAILNFINNSKCYVDIKNYLTNAVDNG